MKSIVFIDTYYQPFLNYYYSRYPLARSTSFSQIIRKILDQHFGTSNYYSKNICEYGVKSYDYIVNDRVSQTRWAVENVNKFNLIDRFKILFKIGDQNLLESIAYAQIVSNNPDIVYIQDLNFFSISTLSKLKNKYKIVGQIASDLPSTNVIKMYDLIITSFPHYVKRIEDLGIKCSYLALCFEKSLLSLIKSSPKRIYDITFIGSFTDVHNGGTRSLEYLASKYPVHVWGRGIDSLSPNSPLRRYYHGQAWGIEMYKIFSQSKIVINRHSQLSEIYANNMRLYEATGMGAMLITDYKENLGKIFKIDKEVVAYKNDQELYEKAIYYLNNDEKREKIAKSGQRKTLESHSYKIRVKNLVRIIKENI